MYFKDHWFCCVFLSKYILYIYWGYYCYYKED